MKKYITVFTPTYNREKLLERCYKSLKKQTVKNFDWLIIDDGSSDNTKKIVNEWIQNETEFEIRYIYKENGGLHTAYNSAISNIESELCICLDSDDFFPDNSIELILKLWSCKGGEKYAGIIGNDHYIDGSIVGDELPKVENININEMLINGIGKGDKKLVVRTELYKRVGPMKNFEGEKNFNPNYLNTLISEEYDFLVLNENLCFVEYQATGMSNNIFNQYVNSPNSFAELRRLYMSLKNANFKFIFRNAIHYNSSCIIANNYRDILTKSPKKFITLMTFPLGVLLTAYIKYKSRTKKEK